MLKILKLFFSLIFLISIQNSALATDWSNPFAPGYIQDTNPFGNNYVQDRGVFGYTDNNFWWD